MWGAEAKQDTSPLSPGSLPPPPALGMLSSRSPPWAEELCGYAGSAVLGPVPADDFWQGSLESVFD